jgi:biotin operon repressor
MFQNYFTAAKNAAEVENIQQATENAKIDEQMKRINAEMLGYDLDFKPEQIQHQREIYKLEEAKRSQELEKIANEIGISREQLNWLMQKNAEMKEHGVNIEKDSLLQRKLFQTLDDFVSGKTEISTDQAIAIAGLLLWFTPVGKLGKVGGLLKKMPKGVLKKIPKVKTAPKTTRPNAQTRQNYLDKVAEKVRNSLKNMKTKD